MSQPVDGKGCRGHAGATRCINCIEAHAGTGSGDEVLANHSISDESKLIGKLSHSTIKIRLSGAGSPTITESVFETVIYSSVYYAVSPHRSYE